MLERAPNSSSQMNFNIAYIHNAHRVVADWCIFQLAPIASYQSPGLSISTVPAGAYCNQYPPAAPVSVTVQRGIAPPAPVKVVYQTVPGISAFVMFYLLFACVYAFIDVAVDLVLARWMNFHFGGYSSEVWKTEFPSAVKGRSPGRWSGRSLPVAEAVCRHCLQILTAVAIKIWKFRTIRLLILDQYVSRGVLNDIVGA